MKWLDDLYRGDSSTGTMVMNVKTSRWERKLKMRQWTEGTEKSLMRILEPKKERGVSTLKVGKNIWNYLPKVDRTIKVPGSMMSGSWAPSNTGVAIETPFLRLVPKLVSSSSFKPDSCLSSG